MEVFGIVDVPVWILLIALLFALFYMYSTAHFKKFERLGVNGPKPILGLGNLAEIMKKGYVEALTEWYQKYGRVFGFHEGRHPVLVVGDLDMLRDITVKEFGSFTNRRDFGVRKHAQPPHSEFLNLAADDDWRHKRNTQSPTFSSGKLKKMTYLINKACDSMVQAMREKVKNQEPFEAKRYTGAYTMEVIASTAFGMDIDIQSNPEHLFVKHATKFFDFSVFDPLFLAILTLPFVINIVGLLKLPTLPKEPTDFFTAIVRRALEDRRKDPGKHNDFLDLMVNAAREAETAGETQKTANETENSNGNPHWVDKRKGQGMTEMEIVGASILFFIAGYHTTSATLAHALYHLATNPECQDRLIAEVDEHFPDGKQPTYESITELSYLEMVLYETLRLTPPASMIDRVCTRDTEIRGLKIPAGTTVGIPIYQIHHDPDLWSDPETFDPDRFSPEKRQLHHPLQWIPFGYGPRNCIGMRLALVQAKLALIQLIQNFRFVPNQKTAPLRFGTTFLLTTTKDGVWVTAESRK